MNNMLYCLYQHEKLIIEEIGKKNLKYHKENLHTDYTWLPFYYIDSIIIIVVTIEGWVSGRYLVS